MFNPNARQCVEFNYHSCGEEREGYDVFATEQECISTCMHQGMIIYFNACVITTSVSIQLQMVENNEFYNATTVHYNVIASLLL